MRKKTQKLAIASMVLLISLIVLTTALPSGNAKKSPYSTRITEYPWVTPRNNFYRTGYTESPAPLTDHLLWKNEMFSYDKALCQLGVVIVDGMVITPLISSVGAFDAVTGEKIWESKLPFYRFDDRMSGLTVDTLGKIWVSSSKYVYTLDEFSGEVLTYFNMTPYQRPTSAYEGRLGRVAAPTCVGNMIYVPTREGTLYALEWKRTDAAPNFITLKWHFHDFGNEHLGMMLGSPIVVGSGSKAMIYQSSGDNGSIGHIYALNATGHQVWNFTGEGVGPYTTNYSFIYGGAYDDGKLYYGISRGGPLYCLNATTGSVIWEQYVGGGTFCGPAVAYGRLYIGDKNNTLQCLNQTTGETLWTFDYKTETEERSYKYPTGSYSYLFPYSCPAVASGVVFQMAECYGGPGILFAFNATTGDLIWKSKDLGDYDYAVNAAVADGRVYVKTGAGGTLYCFGKGPTKTALSILSSSMVNGSDALITGSVLDQSPASPDDPIAGASVSLSYAPVGGSYTDIGTVTTASDGTFMHAWTLPASGFYNIMAEWDGDDSYIGSSEEVMVEVETAPPPYPDVPEFPEYGTPEFPAYPDVPEFPEYGTPEFPAYPDVPTAGEVAGEVTGELPAYTTIDIAIAAIAVITLLLVLYAIATGRKPS